MISPRPVVLEGRGVRLEPLTREHAPQLAAAASDGNLWELWFTSVPEPDRVLAYVDDALAGQTAGTMLPWAVRETRTGEIVGSTRYHDIVAPVDRVEIGYTWYAKRWQRSHVNTACKLLLFEYAFESLGCAVVGLRTDHRNFASQRAIEALGVRKDGVIRHQGLRRDGTARDTVMYSLLVSEWPDVKRKLQERGTAPRTGAGEARPIEGARFTHTNLVARDWRRLADFYSRLFGCELVPPERDYSGPELEAGTGVPSSSVKGAHLRLPGFGASGPTLEIYTYSAMAARPEPAVNRAGFGHLAFAVDSVEAARRAVLEAGGKPVGEIVTLSTSTGARVTWCYVTDPEGNILELQSWA